MAKGPGRLLIALQYMSRILPGHPHMLSLPNLSEYFEYDDNYYRKLCEREMNLLQVDASLLIAHRLELQMAIFKILHASKLYKLGPASIFPGLSLQSELSGSAEPLKFNLNLTFNSHCRHCLLLVRFETRRLLAP